MTTHKPIKRSPALIQFSKDHHFALLLIWKIRQGLSFGVNAARIGSYVNFFFMNYLKVHFKEEETLLFIHLDKNNALRKAAEEDHIALIELAEKNNSKPDTTTLTEFASKLESHVRFEERTLFKELQKNLDQGELNFISDKMNASHKNKTKDKWEDEFWNRDHFKS